MKEKTQDIKLSLSKLEDITKESLILVEVDVHHLPYSKAVPYIKEQMELVQQFTKAKVLAVPKEVQIKHINLSNVDIVIATIDIGTIHQPKAIQALEDLYNTVTKATNKPVLCLTKEGKINPIQFKNKSEIEDLIDELIQIKDQMKD